LLTVATPGVADTQGLVAAAVPEPVNVVVDPIHVVKFPVMVGAAVTVTVAVILHPLLFVYVITLVPAPTPVTTPVLLTVATPGVPETQGFVAAAVPDPVKLVVAPTQTVNVPVIVGFGLTVTVAVAVQPVLFVYVITLVPPATPVTTPVLLTVATPGVPDTHGLVAAAVPEPVKGVVEPTQTVKVPDIVGAAFTVTVAVALQPLLFV
jgi:hypothetical protein